MPCKTKADPCLAPLLQALEAISEAARSGMNCTTAEEAVDVIVALESAARVTLLEHYGVGNDADPAWDVRYATTDIAGPEEVPF
jgi:hypothetical protein